MHGDPIHGQTLTFHFDDGPMQGKSFAHDFTADGKVTYRTDSHDAKPSAPIACAVEEIDEHVWAIAYVGAGGTGLTVVLDFTTGRLVAFAADGRSVTAQHGSFESVRRAA